MRYAVLSVVAIAMLMVASFAHLHLGRHVQRDRVRLPLLRLFLFATGGLFGYMAATLYGARGFYYALVFVIGFGMVHVPAAVILFIKGERAK